MDGAGQKALCALRVTDLPSPPPPFREDAQVPRAGRGQLPEPRRRSPSGGGERSLGPQGDPAHLKPPGSRSRHRVPGSPGSSAAPLPAPASPDTRAQRGPQTQPGRSSAAGQRARNAPATAAWPREAQRPAHLGPRPSWTSSILTAAWRGTTQRPAHLRPASPGPALSREPPRGEERSVPSTWRPVPKSNRAEGRTGSARSGAPPQPSTRPIRLRLFCRT